MSNQKSGPNCGCKIGRITDKYELSNLNSRLEQRRKDDEASLRELADFINKQILKAALDSNDVDIENHIYDDIAERDTTTAIYQVLTGDDMPADRVARVQTRLSQVGIDIETIENDWVTHPTVRAHLQDYIGIDTSRSKKISTEDAQNTIEWARTKYTKIIEQTFQRLRSANIVSTGPLTATTIIKVTCTECGDTFRPSQLIGSEGCSCEPGDSDEQ